MNSLLFFNFLIWDNYITLYIFYFIIYIHMYFFLIFWCEITIYDYIEMDYWLIFWCEINISYFTFLFYNLYHHELFLNFLTWGNYTTFYIYIAYIYMYCFKAFSCEIIKYQTYFFLFSQIKPSQSIWSQI